MEKKLYDSLKELIDKKFQEAISFIPKYEISLKPAWANVESWFVKVTVLETDELIKNKSIDVFRKMMFNPKIVKDENGNSLMEYHRIVYAE